MKKIISVIILIVVLLVILGLWKRPITETASSQTLKVGVLLPLSEGWAWWGDSIKNGIKVAENKGLIKNIEFIYQDTKCNTKDAVSGTMALKSQYPSMHIFIVGCDNDLKAMLSSLNKETDLAFVAGLSGSDLYETNFPIINLSYRLESEAAVVAGFAAHDLGVKKLGLIMSDQNFDVVLSDLIPKDFVKYGGQTTMTEIIKVNEPRPETSILKLLQGKPDAIYIHNDIPAMATILKRLDQLGFKGPRIMTYGARGQAFIDAAGKSAEGVYVPWVISNKLSEKQQVFFDSFKQVAGVEPFVTSYFAYDGVTLLGLAHEACNMDVRCIEDYFYTKNDLDGLLGKVVYRPGGQIERTFYIEQVKDGKFVQVE